MSICNLMRFLSCILILDYNSLTGLAVWQLLKEIQQNLKLSDLGIFSKNFLRGVFLFDFRNFYVSDGSQHGNLIRHEIDRLSIIRYNLTNSGSNQTGRTRTT
jgi:hypothetical protein